MLTSQFAWDMLPHLEKGKDVEDNSNGLVGEQLRAGAIEYASEKDSPSSPFLTPGTLHKASSRTSFASVDSSSDLDEKFVDTDSDVVFSTPLITETMLPSEDEQFEDSSILDPPLAIPSSPVMQEVSEVPGSFPSRPTWSVRASEANLRSQGATLSYHSQRSAVAGNGRRPYTADAGFDAALAMQLRPGLGIGADAAWLVRFVMAVFGWCAILVSGQNA